LAMVVTYPLRDTESRNLARRSRADGAGAGL